MEFTQMEDTYSSKTYREGLYRNSLGKEVNLPQEFKRGNDVEIIYRESTIKLAYSSGEVKIAFFEWHSSLEKSCQIHVLSPSIHACTTEKYKRKTWEEAAHECLNHIAFDIEKYCGQKISCNVNYSPVLSPL